MLRMLTPVKYLQSLDGFANATPDTSILYVLWVEPIKQNASQTREAFKMLILGGI